jgi:hypothetical protein
MARTAADHWSSFSNPVITARLTLQTVGAPEIGEVAEAETTLQMLPVDIAAVAVQATAKADVAVVEDVVEQEEDEVANAASVAAVAGVEEASTRTPRLHPHLRARLLLPPAILNTLIRLCLRST